MTDLKVDLAALYIKAGLKNIGCMFLMTDAQVKTLFWFTRPPSNPHKVDFKDKDQDFFKGNKRLLIEE